MGRNLPKPSYPPTLENSIFQFSEIQFWPLPGSQRNGGPPSLTIKLACTAIARFTCSRSAVHFSVCACHCPCSAAFCARSASACSSAWVFSLIGARLHMSPGICVLKKSCERRWQAFNSSGPSISRRPPGLGPSYLTFGDFNTIVRSY